MGEKILQVMDLRTSFRTQRGEVTAVDGVSFHVDRGEILGLVGESGCGKSVTSQSILRLYDERRDVRYAGQVLFGGRDLLALPEKEMRSVRGGEIAMVFQDSLSALNPVLTCGDQIMEAMRIHQKLSKAEARENDTGLSPQASNCTLRRRQKVVFPLLLGPVISTSRTPSPPRKRLSISSAI